MALVGKGTYDYRDRAGAGDNLMPRLLASTNDGLFAADQRVADVDDDGVVDLATGSYCIPFFRYRKRLPAYREVWLNPMSVSSCNESTLRNAGHGMSIAGKSPEQALAELTVRVEKRMKPRENIVASYLENTTASGLAVVLVFLDVSLLTVFSAGADSLLVGGGRERSVAKVKLPEAACAPDCERDIGTLMQHPTTTFQTVTESCSGVDGCNDCFEMLCPIDTVITLSFCQGGGTADFDTGISAFNGPIFDQEVGCADDSCGTLSELVYTFTAEELVRFRVVGLGTASGSYTLAYRVDTKGTLCTISGAVPIELVTFSVD